MVKQVAPAQQTQVSRGKERHLGQGMMNSPISSARKAIDTYIHTCMFPWSLFVGVYLPDGCKTTRPQTAAIQKTRTAHRNLAPRITSEAERDLSRDEQRYAFFGAREKTRQNINKHPASTRPPRTCTEQPQSNRALLTFFTAWLIWIDASRTALDVNPVGPPKAFLTSTIATEAPSRAACTAAASPPGPDPSTTKSYGSSRSGGNSLCNENQKTSSICFQPDLSMRGSTRALGAVCHTPAAPPGSQHRTNPPCCLRVTEDALQPSRRRYLHYF